MTVKELKMMLNDMPDDAILLTRNALTSHGAGNDRC